MYPHNSNTITFFSRLRLSALAPFLPPLLTLAILAPSTRAQTLPWDHQPYRVRTLIALDVPGGIADQLAAQLPTYLERRVVAAIGPIWSFNATVENGAARQHVFAEIASQPDKPPTNIPVTDVDKLILVVVRWSPESYSLLAREFDTLVQRWSAPIHREVRQPASLPEQVFAILCQAFAPLAQFELIPDDEKHVSLKPRGAALMRPGDAEPWTRPGDVFLPILRRTTRGGQLVEKGIQAVPWTLVEVIDNKGTQTSAQILSGTRRPFGVRRQGRVEQVAIALRSDPADTTLRLRSRVAKDKPLVGYEVFAQNDPGKPDDLTCLGATDRNGKLEIAPAKKRRARVLFIKNGENLLARLPVVPGAEPELDVPLPDDDARLAAEAQLAAMREDLIDIVARRNILMARARQKIEKKDFESAQKLVLEINQLPGRAQFTIELTNAARRMRSADPQIQRRIDQLFEGTQAALAQYLDPAPINNLSDELRTAQQRKGG